MNYCCSSVSFSVLRKDFRYRCKCSKRKLAAKLRNNFNLIISINLFYFDAIDNIFFERNVSGNSSDVTLTREESFAE